MDGEAVSLPAIFGGLLLWGRFSQAVRAVPSCLGSRLHRVDCPQISIASPDTAMAHQDPIMFAQRILAAMVSLRPILPSLRKYNRFRIDPKLCRTAAIQVFPPTCSTCGAKPLSTTWRTFRPSICSPKSCRNRRHQFWWETITSCAYRVRPGVSQARRFQGPRADDYPPISKWHQPWVLSLWRGPRGFFAILFRGGQSSSQASTSKARASRVIVLSCRPGHRPDSIFWKNLYSRSAFSDSFCWVRPRRSRSRLMLAQRLSRASTR